MHGVGRWAPVSGWWRVLLLGRRWLLLHRRGLVNDIALRWRHAIRVAEI